MVRPFRHPVNAADRAQGGTRVVALFSCGAAIILPSAICIFRSPRADCSIPQMGRRESVRTRQQNNQGGNSMAMAVTQGALSASDHSAQLRKAVIASTIGTAIEWYDFFLYGTAAGLIFGKLYFPNQEA